MSQAMLEGTWLEKLPSDVWEDIVMRLPIETLLCWGDDVSVETLRRNAGDRWVPTLEWTYVTADGPQQCVTNHLIETFDVDLPYDWVPTYRFFHVTNATFETVEVTRSFIHVFPRMGPLLHLHCSWISTGKSV